MPENQYVVKNLFPHNYPVVRGEFLRNPETLSEEKLAELVAKGSLEKVAIVPAAKEKAETAAKGKDAASAETPATAGGAEVKNAKK